MCEKQFGIADPPFFEPTNRPGGAVGGREFCDPFEMVAAGCANESEGNRPERHIEKSPPDGRGHVILALRNGCRDDLDLPFGRLRMRASGSSGGHNGLKSLIEVFGQDFPRLRVGIGRDREDAAAIRHVLGAFSAEESAALPELVERCIAGIDTWLDAGIAAAMNRVNVRDPKRTAADDRQDG